MLRLVPGRNSFRVSFTFGEKATQLILTGHFPEALKAELSNTKKYAEGRTIQLEIKTEADLKTAKNLIRRKAEN